MMIVSVLVETKEQIIDKVAQYLHWLMIPKTELNNMPVCPFVKPELSQNNLYMDVWYPEQNTFMELMEDYLLSDKNSALFICPDTNTIDYSEVSRSDIQKKILKLLRANPQTEHLKALCMSPHEPWELAGIDTRKPSPYFLINIVPSKQLSKAHKDLQKTKYFDNYTDEDRKKMKVFESEKKA